MAQTETNQNFKMIHIASELVALIGVTFYFTSKYNSLNQDIKKMQNIIQQQHSKIQSMDNQIKELYNLIQKLNINRKPIINENFKNPVDVFAQVIGVSDISKNQDLPFENNLENYKSNIEIIDDSKNNQNDLNQNDLNQNDLNQNDLNQNGLDTESELDDQLVAELSELHHLENKSNQLSTQLPVQNNKPNVNIIAAQNSESHKIQPIQQNNVLIDFLNTNPKKSPSNTSQLSVQDDIGN